MNTFGCLDPAEPAISVILAFRKSFTQVQRTILALQGQTEVRQLEIVLVAPSRIQAGVDESMLRSFWGWQLIEQPLASHGCMYARGIRAARAPLTVLAEDHSFPACDWAEKLIAAHFQGEWAVVGPAIRNGNPETFTSWADFYIAYGKWAVPIKSQEMEYLPGHNSCYRRLCLIAYGARLESLLESEVVLHWDLRAQGVKLWLEGTTYTRHLNFAKFRPWMGAQLYAGRIFASERGRNWAWWRRALYALAAPLIPLVRFGRISKDVRRAKFPIFFRWCLYAYIMFGLGVDGVGQFLGYALSIGEHINASMEYEFERERYL